MSGRLIPLAYNYDITATEYSFPRLVKNVPLQALWDALRLR